MKFINLLPLLLSCSFISMACAMEGNKEDARDHVIPPKPHAIAIENKPTELHHQPTTSLSSASVSAISNEPNNLLDFVDKIQDVYYFSSTQGIIPIAKGSEEPTIGNFHVTTMVAPVSDKSYDYFWVGQQYILSPDKECNIFGYRVTLTPEHPELFDIISTSPDTTQGQTTTTSSTSYTLGGNIGFSGGKPTIGVPGSYSMTNSTSFTSPDVTILNKSPLTNTRSGVCWDFKIKPRSLMSENTFQPFVQTLWRIKREDANKVTRRVYTEKEITSYGRDNDGNIHTIPTPVTIPIDFLRINMGCIPLAFTSKFIYAPPIIESPSYVEENINELWKALDENMDKFPPSHDLDIPLPPPPSDS